MSSNSAAEHNNNNNSGDRNAEIWSTRVQRELLALTTENAPEQDKKDTQGVLPSFMMVQDHTLDIASGTCMVSFRVEIEGPRRQRTPKSSPVSSPTNKNNNNNESSEGDDTETTTTTTTTSATESSSSNDDNKKAVVTITLDASLVKRSDGTLDTAAPAYPFLPPNAFITDGASEFPDGSTLQNGDMVTIDCDWTPSLHLSDAVLNIGLKIKESILQQEPFHPAAAAVADGRGDQNTNIGENIDELVAAGARAIGDKIGKFKGAFTNKKKKKKDTRPAAVPGEIRIGDEINLLEPPWVEAQGIYSCKAVRRPEFVEAAIQHAALVSGENVSPLCIMYSAACY